MPVGSELRMMTEGGNRTGPYIVFVGPHVLPIEEAMGKFFWTTGLLD